MAEGQGLGKLLKAAYVLAAGERRRFEKTLGRWLKTRIPEVTPHGPPRHSQNCFSTPRGTPQAKQDTK